MSTPSRLDGHGVEQRIPWWWTKIDDDASRSLATRRDLPTAEGTQHWLRAVLVDTAPNIVYDWLTQLRRAPYSYDWLDNFGRRSPRRLDSSAGEIVAGDTVMTIFTAAEVTPGRSFILELSDHRWSAVCGRLSVKYEAAPHGRGTLLSAELVVPLASGPFLRLRRYLLAWGDLAMMRKQLISLASLAEQDERSASARAERSWPGLDAPGDKGDQDKGDQLGT